MEGENRILVGKSLINASIPLNIMYQEHQLVGYKKCLKNYIKIIKDVMGTYN